MRSSIVLVSPLLVIASYRLLLETLISLTRYAWIICNIFYYLLWCLLFVVLVSRSSFKALISSFKPRRIASRGDRIVVSIIVLFFIFIGVSSFINNAELILHYLPQTVLFMIVNPFFEEIYWRGFLFREFREKWLLSATYSSIMFGFFHYITLYPLIPYLITCSTLVVIAFFGFLWTILYEISNSLLPPYICHSAMDVIGYLVMSGFPIRF